MSVSYYAIVLASVFVYVFICLSVPAKKKQKKLRSRNSCTLVRICIMLNPRSRYILASSASTVELFNMYFNQTPQVWEIAIRDAADAERAVPYLSAKWRVNPHCTSQMRREPA